MASGGPDGIDAPAQAVKALASVDAQATIASSRVPERVEFQNKP